MLDFRDQRPGLELRGAQIVARVLGQESNNFLKFLRIDLGAAQGIRVGMPVVTDLGLVGRISKVEASTADVLLITDVSSAVNARLQNSRLTGVIRGDPGGALLMDFIPQGVEFGRNEVIVTSGLGSSFPSGINIGQVVLRIQNDIESAQQATVAPIVNFDALELVAVVTNFNPLDVEPELQAGQGITDGLILTGTETLTATNILTGTP